MGLRAGFGRGACLIIAFLLLSFNNDFAAGHSYKFRTLSPKGGFYYDGVKSIVQDSDGFIWILMDNDLQRFDGYGYKRYYAQFRNMDDKSRWIFNDIEVDPDGNLYVATDNGLYVYDKLSDSFRLVYRHNSAFLAIDKKGNIWLRDNFRLGILCDADSLYLPLYNDRPVGNITATYSDANRLVVASVYGRILGYDYNSKNFHHIYSFPTDHNIASISMDGTKLWVLVADKGLFCVNVSSGKLEKHYDFMVRDERRDIPVKVVHADKNGMVWIGTQSGIFVLDPHTGEYRHFVHSRSDLFSLPNNSVWTITEDSKRNLWIGTFSGGVCMVDPDESERFRTYTPMDSPLNVNMVSAFAEDRRYLWIGTEGGGLNRMDKSTGRFDYFMYKTHANSLSYNNVKSLVLDDDGRLWIAMFRGGLDCYDTKADKFTSFSATDPRDNENRLLYNNLRKIIPDDGKGLWIAYQHPIHVISRYSFDDRRFTHYYFDKDDTGIYMFDMLKGNGCIWIITAKKLYRMNLDDLSVKDVSSKEFDFLNAQSMCVDNNGNLWIGTIGRGIIMYDPKTYKFKVFDQILQYNTSTIYSMSVDDDNNIWLGTDNGLFRYDIARNNHTRFDEDDGVQGRVYTPLACMKSVSGELYFGGTNGFTRINPRNIVFNESKPKVIISDFMINSASAVPDFKGDMDSYFGNEIKLKHTQSDFGFVFSSDNYLMPKKNMYRYRLRGYEQRWKMTDASNRNAFYSKVPPGNYTFEIAAANNDGVWGDTQNVKITLLPSPWMSWQAYLIYTLLGLGVIAMILYHYISKRRLKVQMYIDNMDKQKKEELHQSQLRFFTNISHDFRTPLSLILAATDNLKKEGVKDYYYRILNSNSQRLLNLVNELMDFRTVEKGKMQLQVRLSDVNKAVSEIASDFDDYARKKEMAFEVKRDPVLSRLTYVDKHVFEKIVMNLLNNAMKYTNNGGSVSIETYSSPDGFSSGYRHSYTVGEDSVALRSGAFLLVVRDTGVGISEESISSVFERFYKVKTANLDSHLGTGIGLALVKSLVILHKGTITIHSERDRGTDIVVALPVNADAYSEEEFYKEIPAEAVGDAQQLPDEPAGSELLPPDNMDDMLLPDKKRVLLVEDNNDLRILIANFLSADFEVIQASNGLIASKYLEDNEVDLILCDIMMPLKDGVTLCREVKANVNTSHIPFIILSAKTELRDKIEGADSGADIYFEKPIDFNLLLLTIQNMFKHQSSLREYYAKNYFVDSAELSANEQDNVFLKKLVDIIDKNLTEPIIDVNYIASELSMSRSKLYSKVKTLTDKSIVEFILNYRLRKAAKLIIEQDLSMKEAMEMIGIRSQSYFTSAFKKEFGETPAAFAARHKSRDK